MVFLILSLGLYAFSRAYIYFKNFDDILSFKERFDNYVFLDSKSNEYPAVVEFAQYQRRYKNNSDNFQKKDSKCNTIEQDSDYIKFLENFDKPSGDTLPSCEANLEELEQKERDKLANGLTGSDATFAAPKVITPLLEYMRKKREEKKMLLKEVCCFLKLIKQMKSFIYLFCYLQRDRDLKKRREEERRNNKRYDNRDRDRDRERERERDYGYSGASSSKNFNGSNSQRSHKSNKEPLPSTSNIDPSNVKILTKSSQTKNPSNNDSNKSSASSSNHHNTESKAGSFGSKSSNDSNNNSNNKDMSNKHSSAKSNYNSYKNNNSGHNSSRNSNKESNYNEFSNDGASSSYTNNENKKSNTDQNNSNNSNQQQNKKEGYDSKDASKPGVVKNKDRPSIEIYNPAARRQQKQQPPAK